MATNAELQHLAANTLSPDPRSAATLVMADHRPVARRFRPGSTQTLRPPRPPGSAIAGSRPWALGRDRVSFLGSTCPTASSCHRPRSMETQRRRHRAVV